jgi:hypothetical protein
MRHQKRRVANLMSATLGWQGVSAGHSLGRLRSTVVRIGRVPASATVAVDEDTADDAGEAQSHDREGGRNRHDRLFGLQGSFFDWIDSETSDHAQGQRNSRPCSC